MNKKKRFYMCRHMDEKAVMPIIVADIEKFCKAYYKNQSYRLAYLGGCQAYQVMVGEAEINFVPEQKKLVDAYHNGFGREKNFIWLSSFDIFADKYGVKSYYALYKMKNGQRLIIEKEALLEQKRILARFQIGQKIFKYTDHSYVEVTDEAERKKIAKILSKL